jgi:hypothetical protein
MTDSERSQPISLPPFSTPPSVGTMGSSGLHSSPQTLYPGLPPLTSSSLPNLPAAGPPPMFQLTGRSESVPHTLPMTTTQLPQSFTDGEDENGKRKRSSMPAMPAMPSMLDGMGLPGMGVGAHGGGIDLGRPGMMSGMNTMGTMQEEDYDADGEQRNKKANTGSMSSTSAPTSPPTLTSEPRSTLRIGVSRAMTDRIRLRGMSQGQVSDHDGV